MKKLGFTLAEVLITLGIVGVIAAITIPSMSRNVSQKSIGPALAKAVNNLATVNTEALKQSGYTKLSDIVKSGSLLFPTTDYTNVLSKYMDGMREAGVTADQATGTVGKDPVFYGNDGISYTVPVGLSTANITSKIMKDSEKYEGHYWRVTIGIKGAKSKKPGYDKFLVYVDDYGTVIPAGGTTAASYGAKYDGSELDSKVDCANLTSVQATGRFAVDKVRCTATVAENGWKVTY